MTNHGVDIRRIEQFLRSIRLQNWIRVWAQEFQRLLWIVAGLLLILAAFHALVKDVSVTIVAVPIIAVSIALALRAIYRRPTLADSAALADKKFGGRSLMATAIEIFDDNSTAHHEAANIVLTQAGAAVRSWQADAGRVADSAWRSTTVFAVIPFFAAGILLSMPGADSRYSNAGRDARSSTLAADATPEPGQGVEFDIDALRRGLADTNVDNSADSAAARGDAGTRREQDVRVIRRVAAADSGDLPGEVEAQQSAPQLTAEVQYLSRETVAIARAGADLAVESSSPSQFTTSVAPTSLTMAGDLIVTAAAAPAGDSQWSSLSHAQAAYAQRYLDASRSTDERDH